MDANGIPPDRWTRRPCRPCGLLLHSGGPSLEGCRAANWSICLGGKAASATGPSPAAGVVGPTIDDDRQSCVDDAVIFHTDRVSDRPRVRANPPGPGRPGRNGPVQGDRLDPVVGGMPLTGRPASRLLMQPGGRDAMHGGQVLVRRFLVPGAVLGCPGGGVREKRRWIAAFTVPQAPRAPATRPPRVRGVEEPPALHDG